MAPCKILPAKTARVKSFIDVYVFFANGHLDGRSFVAICTLATSGLDNCQDYKFDWINFKQQ